MQNIVEKLNGFRDKIIHIIANMSGRTESKAEILLIIILGYIVVILLLRSIHRRLLKKQKKVHENLVLLYDTIRYQITKAQYENPAIQENKGIKIIIESEHKNYLGNFTMIKKEITTIEQKLGQQIISADQRIIINKQTKKKNGITTFVQFIGRLITLLTLGIYKLFW